MTTRDRLFGRRAADPVTARRRRKLARLLRRWERFYAATGVSLAAARLCPNDPELAEELAERIAVWGRLRAARLARAGTA